MKPSARLVINDSNGVSAAHCSPSHCRLHIEIGKIMFGFVCSSQIVTHQDNFGNFVFLKPNFCCASGIG